MNAHRRRTSSRFLSVPLALALCFGLGCGDDDGGEPQREEQQDPTPELIPGEPIPPDEAYTLRTSADFLIPVGPFRLTLLCENEVTYRAESVAGVSAGSCTNTLASFAVEGPGTLELVIPEGASLLLTLTTPDG